MKQVVRIGCSSGFWGDSSSAAFQLVKMGGHLDYLVADYLAEVTMGILAKARAAGVARGGAGEGGYINEFVKTVWQPLMKDIMKLKIKIVTNAGGMNPSGLKAAIEKAAKDANVEVPVIAVVLGDDITSRLSELKKDQKLKPFALEGEEEPLSYLDKKVLSMNAYLGALPIAEALAAGAQIVLTGRCVDSAIALGPLIHEFGWKADQYDLLSAGSLAGHIIECGCQATGGNFTDWEESYKAGWSNVGFPIAECHPDGTFVVTKPENTGGIVTAATVTEQMLYEIGDPASYLLPDVTCDWRYVQVLELPSSVAGERSNRVRVSGAKGRPPTPHYKVSCTYQEGYRLAAELFIAGEDARRKAAAVAESVIQKAGFIIQRRNLPPLTATNVELLGTEFTYGPNSRAQNAREVVLRIAATAPEVASLGVLGLELAPSALSMAPGITGGGAGRPTPSAMIHHFSVLIAKGEVSVHVQVGADAPRRVSLPLPTSNPAPPAPVQPPRVPSDESLQYRGPTKRVPLIELCFGRSGDKGDAANIGIFVRKPEYFAFVQRVVTPEAVKNHMSHLVKGAVSRYTLPGVLGFNFILLQALLGGGSASLSIDRQGKTYAQQLLQLQLEVPAHWGRTSLAKL